MNKKALCNPLGVRNAFEFIPVAFNDDRGSFTKFFDMQFQPEWQFEQIKQVNISTNHKIGTVRGLHYQREPYNEQKIVTCLKGRVLDVVVDIDPNSPTYKLSKSVVLESTRKNAIFIPHGFAHGYQVLEPDTELLYLHSELYAPASEAGINPFDSSLNINWPLKVSTISEKDRQLPYFSDIEGKDL